MKLSHRLTLGLTALVGVFPALSSAETLYGVTFDNQLISFDSAAPSVLLSGTHIGGLLGENVIGIDFRPATGALYGVLTDSRVVTINLTSGATTAVGTLTTPLNGTNFGVGFNPTSDRLRITSDIRQNLRVDPNTATTIVDGTITYVDGTSTTPQVTGNAYDSTGKLYGIDAFSNNLVSFDSPNAGTIRSVGPLGLNASGLQKLVISSSGIAFASIQTVGVSGSSLYTINLATGAATNQGVIGPGGAVLQLRGLASQPVPEPASFAVVGVGLIALLRRKRK